MPPSVPATALFNRQRKVFIALAWRPGDKSFGFWLRLRQRATTLEYVVDLLVVSLGEVGAPRLAGSPKGSQKEPIYRASS